MKLYPKCMTGRKPFVTCHGFLSPCCWLDVPRYKTNKLIYDEYQNLVKNIFNDDKFNLNINSFKQVIESDDWWMSLERLQFLEYNSCKVQCTNKLNLSYDEFRNNIIESKDLNEIQLELTNKCSLKCLYCARLNDKIKKSELDIAIVEDILQYKYWDKISDIGTYGDTMFYEPYKQFLELIVKYQVKLYSVNLAATGRGKEWWDDIVNLYKQIILSGTKVKIYFGIDGLEDTSKLHRVGQDWEEITYALRKCIDSGCEVVWQFIPMSFNEHQIEEARKLAKEWGCVFHLYLSDRFLKNDINTPKNPLLFINHDN